ncbi:MAG: MBL fold metallo-hydrolase [Verrucomicrobia bacterium]|nr:MBL fold metallo-hydrolase [Verrucomicrobiota bacterium]
MKPEIFPARFAYFLATLLAMLTAGVVAQVLYGTTLSAAESQVNKVQQLAHDVYFHEGDIQGHGHCNNGWVVFEDYVLVIDGNFPSGANEIIPKIRAISNKPIRFAFDTHHHGDHAYGNQVWADNGAVAVAHTGVLEEMKKYEPGRWNDAAKSRPDVAASKLKPPTLLFPDKLIFDDGKHRVELIHFGVAHTHGDGFAWLPKEKIVFTGDACVNGAYNYVADGNIEQWIKTLDGARKLGATTVCPGHGPIGTSTVLDDQQVYFTELRKQVKLHLAKTPEAMRDAVDGIKATLQKQEQIARYVGDGLGAQVEKVYVEMGGKAFPTAK